METPLPRPKSPKSVPEPPTAQKGLRRNLEPENPNLSRFQANQIMHPRLVITELQGISYVRMRTILLPKTSSDPLSDYNDI